MGLMGDPSPGPVGIDSAIWLQLVSHHDCRLPSIPGLLILQLNSYLM